MEIEQGQIPTSGDPAKHRMLFLVLAIIVVFFAVASVGGCVLWKKIEQEKSACAPQHTRPYSNVSMTGEPGPYSRNDCYVYFMENGTTTPVVGADLATFTPLLDPRGYASFFAKDAEHVFYRDRAQNADPTKFSLIYDSRGNFTQFAKDTIAGEGTSTGNVYFVDNASSSKDIILLKDADWWSFSPIFCENGDGTLYAKDKNHVYFNFNPTGNSQFSASEVRIVEGADPATFKLPSDTDLICGEYGIDNKNVFYNGLIAQDADPKTFNLLHYDEYNESRYEKDVRHVYYLGKLIAGADAPSFTAITTDTGKDKRHTYYQGKVTN